MVKIAPSILSADFYRLGDEITSISTADYIHFDVMDGSFVPNISFGLPILKSVRKMTDMMLDVHLMIRHPSQFATRFADAGADIITFHVEAESSEKTHFTLDEIHKAGKRAGLSLKPETPVDVLLPFIEKLDVILIMTVEPGYGGQDLITSTLPKVTELRKIIDSKGYHCELEVDGGVNIDTARLCITAGADILVTGSDVFKSSDRAEHISQLRRAGGFS